MYLSGKSCIYDLVSDKPMFWYDPLYLKYYLNTVSYKVSENWRRQTGTYDIVHTSFKIEVTPSFPVFEKLLKEYGDEESVAKVIDEDPKLMVVKGLLKYFESGYHSELKPENNWQVNVVHSRINTLEECADKLSKILNCVIKVDDIEKIIYLPY